MPSPVISYWYKLYTEPTTHEELLEAPVASLGIPYRFQHIFHNKYILDYAFPTLKIALEIDGDSHNKASQKKHDEKRAEFLLKRGWKVIRIRNEFVKLSPWAAVDHVMEKLELPYRTKRI